MIKIRPYVREDQTALLALIERSISTDRTPASWQGNPMNAVLAWDGDALIGALPMERRVFQLGRGAVVQVLWISAAHVDEACRSQGLGAKLDAFAREHFAGKFDAFCVYREDETSAAYNWYRKMGYFPVLPILAFRKDVADTHEGGAVVMIENSEDAGRHGDALLACFDAVACFDGGYPTREASFWQRVFNAHYYAAHYEYSILALPADDDGFTAFALLGRTDMRDGVDRFDILEFIAPEGAVAMRLHDAVESHARTLGLAEVRLQTGAAEALRWWAEDKGYVSRARRTNILASLMDARAYLKGRLADNLVDNNVALTIETPTRGRMIVTQDGEDLSLFMSDETLHQLAFNRLDPVLAVDEGRIVVLRGNLAGVRKLARTFGYAAWRYMQVDYI